MKPNPANIHNELDLWTSDPRQAFLVFVRTEKFLKLGRRLPTVKKAETPDDSDSTMPLRDSAITIYVAMFNKFFRWIELHHIALSDVKSIHILTFLDATQNHEGAPSKRLKSQIRTRYLRLLEKVFQHIAMTPNPASHAAILSNQTPGGRGKDDPSELLTPLEVTHFLNNLPPPDNWKRIRDRAMLAVSVGAGLKPSEIIGLIVDNIGDIHHDASVPITISAASVSGTSRWHQAQLRSFAVPELEQWLACRKERTFNSDILFPTNTNGEKIHISTLYRCAKQTFTRANIDVNRFGGRTLRNTFAVTELKNGTCPNSVKEFLGLIEDKSMNLYLKLAHMEKINQ